MKKVVVIGGSVIDLFLYPHQKMKLHDSNPGYMKRAFGGVGRNIAENLVRCGVDTTLITVLGKDLWGQEIYENARDLGMCINYFEVKETPLYISVIHESGEDLVSVALMDEIEKLDKERLASRDVYIEPADFIVIDTNMSEETLNYILHTSKVPVFVDTISSQKAIRIKQNLKYIHLLKMNLMEAEALSRLNLKDGKTLDDIGLYFINEGVKEVIITLGSEGIFYQSKERKELKKPFQTQIKNTTGAGDALFAGVIFAKIHGLDPVNTGLAAAAINVQSEDAVSMEMNKQNLLKMMEEHA
ncbi:MAG: carbohydrate kinase family protein [Acholeplasmataceae bacterium]|nr:carbohydrate kinase family protein [Acholeplasmataceae bacterium]MDD4193734.1 carbohydrate kinase family protein [Acholeplasmataceae bacterium]